MTRTPKSRSHGTVVLLHGWWSFPGYLIRAERRLRREGFESISVGYPSVWRPAEEIATRILPALLARRIPSGVSPVHFVTHSMGGLLVRRHLADHPPAVAGRVVMMGPPNQGSEAADFWSRFRLCRWLAGPNLQALGTGPGSFAHSLPPPTFPLLVIAGNHPPFPFWSPLPKPHDGCVTVESTRVGGLSRHVVLPRSHSALPWDSDALDLMVDFLRRDPPPPANPRKEGGPGP